MSSQKPLTTNTPCPCGQDRDYGNCCRPIIDGSKAAPSAEALMRSRYTAHVVVDVEYLIKSWKANPQQPLSKPEIENWASSSQWLGLTIHRCQKGLDEDKEGWVEFSARFIAQGEDTPSFHREYSRFVQENGDWFYIDAEPTKTGRNEPCPCGSGKKFKRCCDV